MWAIESDFVLISELHRSSGGAVYLGRHRPTGRSVVLKERRVSELGHGHSLDHEIAMYEHMPRHANIVTYLGSYRRGDSRLPTCGEVLVMAFEHAAQGDLHHALLKQREAGRYLGETQVLQWFVPIAVGVRHLHSHGIVHRDLKSLNIVLHEGVPKICDLGISRYRSENTMFMQSFCGTPAYLAPELVSSQPYTEKADMWALGVLLYELAALRLPFLANSILEMSHIISRGEYPLLPSHYSVELAELIEQMLQKDQRRRPSVDEAICFATELLTMRKVRQKQQQQGIPSANPAAVPQQPEQQQTAPCGAQVSERQRSRCCAHRTEVAMHGQQTSTSASPPAVPLPLATASAKEQARAQLLPGPRRASGLSAREERSWLRGGGGRCAGWDGHSETTANEGMIPLSRAHSSQLDGSRGYDVQPDGHADNELSSEPESSHSSLREQRLVQRWAERQERQERRPSINTNTRATDAPHGHERAACTLKLDFNENPGHSSSRSILSGVSCPYTSYSDATFVMPPDDELPEGHRLWTREQLHAYLLAQQLARMQRGPTQGMARAVRLNN